MGWTLCYNCLMGVFTEVYFKEWEVETRRETEVKMDHVWMWTYFSCIKTWRKWASTPNIYGVHMVSQLTYSMGFIINVHIFWIFWKHGEDVFWGPDIGHLWGCALEMSYYNLSLVQKHCQTKKMCALFESTSFEKSKTFFFFVKKSQRLDRANAFD